jgi:PAS domain S-box-containing protein
VGPVSAELVPALLRAFESAPIGKVVTDAEGVCVVANPAFERLLGAADGGLAGTGIGELLGPGLLDTDDVSSDERWVGKVDGGSVWLRLVTAAVHEDGELAGYVVQASDQTDRRLLDEERRLANQQLRRSNRELEEFASVASHDLQEPLRKIRAFSDRLVVKHRHQLDDDAREDLDRVVGAATRMQTLIDDLLAYSRLDRRAPEFVEVDLTAIASATAADLEERAVELGGSITVDLLPVVEADEVQMHELFENLIANALKFRRPDVPPEVHIAEHAANEASVTFVCADNGIGFESRYAEQIFSLFERLHGRTEFDGTGIGLAMCRKIADRHGGSIRAEGVPGAGARFYVTLPRRPAERGTDV